METDCPREKLVRPFLNHESARIYRCCNHIRGRRRRGDENRPSLPDDAGAHTAVRIRNRAARDVWRSPQSCAHRICKRDRDLSRVIVHRISSRQLCVLSTCTGAGRSGRRNIDTEWCSDCLLLEIDRRAKAPAADGGRYKSERRAEDGVKPPLQEELRALVVGGNCDEEIGLAGNLLGFELAVEGFDDPVLEDVAVAGLYFAEDEAEA